MGNVYILQKKILLVLIRIFVVSIEEDIAFSQILW